jgi:hypothetical protein
VKEKLHFSLQQEESSPSKKLFSKTVFPKVEHISES